MSNVAPLFAGKQLPGAQPNEALIAALSDLLKMAESGQLQSYIGSGFTHDGLRVSTWCDFHDNVYEVVGSMEWQKAEYIARHT